MTMQFGSIGSAIYATVGTFDVPSSSTTLSIFSWCKFNSLTDHRIISKATDWFEPDHWFMFSGLNTTQMRVRLMTNGTTTTHVETSDTINRRSGITTRRRRIIR